MHTKMFQQQVLLQIALNLCLRFNCLWQKGQRDNLTLQKCFYAVLNKIKNLKYYNISGSMYVLPMMRVRKHRSLQMFNLQLLSNHLVSSDIYTPLHVL